MLQARVLVVEDDKIIQRVMAARLRHLGCFVEVVDNGIDAIARYQDKFDLIFLDIGLPDISGINVCKHIRKQGSKADIPIVVTTTWNDSKESCLEVGVDDFVLKPVSRKALDRLLQAWLPDHSFKTLSIAGKY